MRRKDETRSVIASLTQFPHVSIHNRTVAIDIHIHTVLNPFSLLLFSSPQFSTTAHFYHLNPESLFLSLPLCHSLSSHPIPSRPITNDQPNNPVTHLLLSISRPTYQTATSATPYHDAPAPHSANYSPS